jgi:hypothetical protein
MEKITAMTQDPKGYMWFADEVARCLYRYDGFRTTSFRHDIKDPNSLGEIIFLSSPRIPPLNLDWFSRYWSGSYNPTTGVFKHFNMIPKDPTSLSGTVTAYVGTIGRDGFG